MGMWKYSPEDVTITIGAFHTIEGIPEGTFIEVVKDVMPYVSTRTTDGIVARKYTNNSTFTINLTLMKTSPSNDTLQRLQILDELTHQAKFPLLIRDSNGTSSFFSTETWIEVVPNLSLSSTDIPTVTWGLRSDKGQIFIGGNDNNTALEQLADLALSGLPFVQQVLNAQGVLPLNE